MLQSFLSLLFFLFPAALSFNPAKPIDKITISVTQANLKKTTAIQTTAQAVAKYKGYKSGNTN